MLDFSMPFGLRLIMTGAVACAIALTALTAPAGAATRQIPIALGEAGAVASFSSDRQVVAGYARAEATGVPTPTPGDVLTVTGSGFPAGLPVEQGASGLVATVTYGPDISGVEGSYVVTAVGGSGYGVDVQVTRDGAGTVTAVTVLDGGVGNQVGDVLTVDAGVTGAGSNALSLTVTEILAPPTFTVQLCAADLTDCEDVRPFARSVVAEIGASAPSRNIDLRTGAGGELTGTVTLQRADFEGGFQAYFTGGVRRLVISAGGTRSVSPIQVLTTPQLSAVPAPSEATEVTLVGTGFNPATKHYAFVAANNPFSGGVKDGMSCPSDTSPWSIEVGGFVPADAGPAGPIGSAEDNDGKSCGTSVDVMSDSAGTVTVVLPVAPWINTMVALVQGRNDQPGTVYTWPDTAPGGAVAMADLLRDNAPPGVSFGVNSTVGSAWTGQPISFIANATDAVSDAADLTRVIRWGDGTSTTLTGSALGHTPSHIYTAPGTYTATYTVTDQAGNQAAATVPGMVVTSPTVTRSVNRVSAWTGQTVTLTLTGFTPGVTGYRVSWGDGTATTGTPAATRSHSHVYRAGATFPITVTLTKVGASKVLAPTAVKVTRDAISPTAKVVVPTSRRILAWQTVTIRAADAQSGIASVWAKATQKRGSAWYYFTGTTWVKAVSATAAMSKAKPLRAGSTRKVTLKGLRAGSLRIAGWAIDYAGNVSIRNVITVAIS